jgi:DNA-binding Xre family transcriptional regulator
MKNLKNETCGNLYAVIQSKPLLLSERDVVACLDRSRLDPRLMEIMTEFLRDFWWTQDPHVLNKAAKRAKFPFMLVASLSAIFAYCEIPSNLRAPFSSWYSAAIRTIKKPVPQLLYAGVIPIGSRSMQNEIDDGLPAFKKINLFSKDMPFNKSRPGEIKYKHSLAGIRSNELDVLKKTYAATFRTIKDSKKLKNQDIISAIGVSRSSLSKILNYKIEDISAEYLREKSEALAVAYLRQ